MILVSSTLNFAVRVNICELTFYRDILLEMHVQSLKVIHISATEMQVIERLEEEMAVFMLFCFGWFVYLLTLVLSTDCRPVQDGCAPDISSQKPNKLNMCFFESFFCGVFCG